MSFSDEIDKINRIFIDTAPIIYYIEAHPQFGPLIKELVNSFQSGALAVFTSVITIAEVLPKPIRIGQEKLAKEFMDFLRYGKNFTLIDISADIAETAGTLRGRYAFLRGMDAIQIGTALEIGADAFLTNDAKLTQIKEKVLVLKDYL